MSKLICSLLVGACLAAGSYGQISKANGGYLFRIKYFPGEVLRFETLSTVDNVGNASKGVVVKVPMMMNVRSIAKGIASVDLTMGVGKLGSAVVSEAQTVRIQLDDKDSSKFGGVSVPLKPVKIGSTWTATRPVTLGGQMKPLEAVYRFAGLKTVNGTDVAVITYSLKGVANGSGTMMLLVKDASLYSNEMLISVPGMNNIARLKTVMRRLPEKPVGHKKSH